MRRWDTKRQEISAQSCKIVSPLRHHSNYWVRSPSQEYPKCYYSEAPSMSCRQRDSGFRNAWCKWNVRLTQKIIEYVPREPVDSPPHTRTCGNTDAWKQYIPPPRKPSDSFPLKKWNVPVERSSVFWRLGTPDHEQQISWSSFLRSLT